MINDKGFDPDTLHLGKLCRHKHDHQATGLSLRYNKTSKCKECEYQHRIKGAVATKARKKAAWLAASEEVKERNRQRAKAWGRANAEVKRERVKAYRLAHKEAVKATKKRYWEQNREKINTKRRAKRGNCEVKTSILQQRSRIGVSKEEINAQRRAYYHSHKAVFAAQRKARRCNPEFREQVLMEARASSSKYKARKSSLVCGVVSSKVLRDVFEKFNHECAYCGSKEKLSIDHFLPLCLGGSHAESNLVSACQRCNCSKWSNDPFNWYKLQSFFNQARWSRLLKLLGKKHSNYNQITLL